MRKGISLGLAAAGLILLAGASEAVAQGKGHGLSKAMAAASKGSASSSGLNRATQSVARGNFGKSNGGLNRTAQGLNRSGSLGQATSTRVRDAAINSTETPTLNQERNLDHRLQQSDHLREISERNGNERLLDTADRMDASAIRNYERQTGETYLPDAPIDPAHSPPSGEPLPSNASMPADLDGASLPPTKAAPQARSSWLPAWLRWDR